MRPVENAPELIGHYVIERALARGSMGNVYVAHHELTHARVALKVLRPEVAGDAQAEERFLREVRAAAHIGHEGIVRVHDAGRSADGRLFLAMELLEGETLERRLSRHPGERRRAMQLLLEVLEPLSAAHAQGIIHRDLKPANVFVTHGDQGGGPERVKLLDFGLARDMREKSVTATGIALGTPYYMSPEQASQPRDVGTASDVWSMGVMLYEVLCGTMPFDGETLHAVVIRSSVAPHVGTAELAGGIDAELAALVDQCLDKDPSQRPQDASALRERLSELLRRPEVQRELERDIAVSGRRHSAQDALATHDERTGDDAPAMPFAETAIVPSPRALPRSGRAAIVGSIVLWVLMLGVLSAVAAGLVWTMRSRSLAARSLPTMHLPTLREPAKPTTEGDGPKPPKARKAETSTGKTPGTPQEAKLPPVAVHADAAVAHHEPAALPARGAPNPALLGDPPEPVHDAAAPSPLPAPPAP